MKSPSSSKSGLARYCIRFALIISSVCGTLLTFELAVRTVAPQNLGCWDSRSFRRLLEVSPHFVENIPNGKASFIGVPVNINSDGLRGDEIDSVKPSSTVRILVVGDSITFGYGVHLGETYAKVLERNLNEASPGIKYEVLNGGTLGGSLGDYRHLLERKAAALQPDVVVIGLCLNDILVYSANGGTEMMSSEWGREHISLVRKVNHFVLRHSHLYTLLYPGLKQSIYGFGHIADLNSTSGENFVALGPSTDYQTRAWISSLRMLKELNGYCNTHGYDLVTVVFPMQMQLSERELNFYRTAYHLPLSAGAVAGEPQEKLHQFADSIGMTLVDLLPAYRMHNSKDLYLRTDKIPCDATHPSVEGNQVAADELFRVLSGNRTHGMKTMLQ